MKITSPQQAATASFKSALKPYEDIAEGMEANFTAHLLQEMKKTVPKETPDSAPMDYYNSLLDSERAQLMAKSDTGLGVKKVILDQIVPNHLRPKANSPQTAANLGMMAKEKQYE